MDMQAASATFDNSVASTNFKTSPNKSSPNFPQIKNAYAPMRQFFMKSPMTRGQQSPNSDKSQKSKLQKSQSQISILSPKLMPQQTFQDYIQSNKHLLESYNEVNLLQAKQIKQFSNFQVKAMHGKVLKLERKEQQIQTKIENERKRVEEMNKVREQFLSKVRDLKQMAMDREQKVNETMEKNFNGKLKAQQLKSEKLFECYATKKEARDEVKTQCGQMMRQSELFTSEVQNIKQYNASIIKQQEMNARQKMNQYKEQ